jgi:hypothetical protein
MSPKLSITAQKMSQAIAVGATGDAAAVCSEAGGTKDMAAWVADSNDGRG